MRFIPVWTMVSLLLVGLYCDGLTSRAPPKVRLTAALPFFVRQLVTYNVSAVSVAKPTNQTAGSVLHEMSMVVKNSDLTQNVSDAIIYCLANRTGTPIEDWGLYNHSKFSNTLIQAEYYAYCTRDDVLAFQNGVTQYATDKELPVCVKKLAPSEFVAVRKGDTPDIVYARAIIESLPNGTHHEGWLAAWVVGAVVGSLLSLAIIISTIIMLKRKRVYEPVAYDPEPHIEEKELSEGGKAQVEFEKHIKAITVGYD